MLKKPELKIYESEKELADAAASHIVDAINRLENAQDRISICLSGGRTPRLLFTRLAEKYSDKVNWRKIHFFWGDERCVPSEHIDSNYGMTKSHLLDKINLPEENIHFIDGNNPPVEEAKRYHQTIVNKVRSEYGLPRFDILILGMGDDGHTASIFPSDKGLFESKEICVVTKHPLSGKPRITLTGKVLNNAASIIFLITGKHKASIVEAILKNASISEKYPAQLIQPFDGSLEWFLDKNAASLL